MCTNYIQKVTFLWFYGEEGPGGEGWQRASPTNPGSRLYGTSQDCGGSEVGRGGRLALAPGYIDNPHD